MDYTYHQRDEMRPPGIPEPTKVLNEFVAMQDEAHPRENQHLQRRQVQVGVVSGSGTADGANDIGCRKENK